MSPRENQKRFERRKGQQKWRELIELDSSKSTYTGRFPTGYGKSESIVDAYDVLRSQKGFDRLLLVVPTHTQQRQYVDDLDEKIRRMGIAMKKVVIGDGNARVIKYHLTDDAEIFVATVQAIVSSVSGRRQGGNWMSDLLEKGTWCGAADEYHHLAESNIWGPALRSLEQIKTWIAVSATPDRLHGETIFGDPLISITYEDAFQEGVVKDVAIEVANYMVDIETRNGDVCHRTTTEIRDGLEESKETIDEWETRKQLRYLTKYCSPILAQAVNALDEAKLKAPPDVNPQMVVYAFSCNHASSLVTVLGACAPQFRVDWAGTGFHGRSDKENDTVIQEFKEGKIDILVQVNIAGEGFNCPGICVIVDLSLSELWTPQKIQHWGRGTRTYHDYVLTIFVPEDSKLSNLAPMRRAIFDLPINTVPGDLPPRRPPTWPPPPPPPLPDTHVLDAHLLNWQHYEPSRETIIKMAPLISEKAAVRGKSMRLDPENNPEDFEIVREALISFHRKAEHGQSEEQARKYWQDKVTTGVGKVARAYVMWVSRDGFEKSQIGDACRRINAEWKWRHDGHDAMTAIEFKAKYAWLCEVNLTIIDGNPPSWLRQ